MLALLDPRVWLAVLLLMGGSYVTGRFQQSQSDSKAQVAATLKATQGARETEANWQINLEAQNELDTEERARMAADYDRGLVRVRNRAAARLPAAAASACAGASPEQLAGPDAAAFERLGRDARAVQLDLEKARGWIEEVTHPK